MNWPWSSPLKRKSLEELAQMSVDEKIEMALAELEELDAKKFSLLHRKRRDQLTFALEAWWMTKGMSVR